MARIFDQQSDLETYWFWDRVAEEVTKLLQEMGVNEYSSCRGSYIGRTEFYNGYELALADIIRLAKDIQDELKEVLGEELEKAGDGGEEDGGEDYPTKRSR